MNRRNSSDIIDEIEKCLISLGIAKSQLVPNSNSKVHQAEFNLFRSTDSSIFPLDWFDSHDNDEIEFFKSCKLGEWISLLFEEDIQQQTEKEMSNFNNSSISAGFAFLPEVRDTDAASDDAFDWREVQVEVYDEMSNKWRVKTNSSDSYDVSRVYLMFSVEQPTLFAQRVLRAVSQRAECERQLRFEAFVDQIPLSHVPKPPQRIRMRIRDLLLHFQRHQQTDSRWFELLEWEYCMIYQRMQAKDEFVRYAMTTAKTETQPSFFAAIQLPTVDKKLENVVLREAQKSSSEALLKRMTFEQSRRDFQRMWLYCCPEAIKIMDIVNNNCKSVTTMSLFHIQTKLVHNAKNERVIDLNGFVDAHNGQLSVISSFLHREWIGFVVEKMEFHLRESRRSWFDVDVNDWYIYRHSKLFRLIELVKLRMEMALRDGVRRSTRAYVDALCDPCEGFLSLDEDFVWGSSLMASQFHSERPIFTLSIVFDEFARKYTYSCTDLDEFRLNITRIFNSTVLVTHEVPQLDPFLIENLKFDRSLRLSSVGTHDDEIRHHLQRLESCYRACVKPLKAYVEEFKQRFCEFRVLNVSDYLERMKMLNFNELKTEIDSQLQQIDKVKQTVPLSIVIGPFEVEVEKVRSELIVKCKLLHDSLRRLLIGRIDSSLTSIKLKFDGIFSKLTQHVACVEELVELRNWIPNVPYEVEKLVKQLEDVEYDEIDILAQLFIPLRDEMFGTLVHNRLMPSNIIATIEDVASRLDFEFEQFRKLQMTHQVSFIEQVEGIVATTEMEIYSPKQKHSNDDDDNDDVGGSIGKVWNVLDNLRKHGAMLNNRQRIFNQPEIDMASLNGETVVHDGTVKHDRKRSEHSRCGNETM